MILAPVLAALAIGQSAPCRNSDVDFCNRFSAEECSSFSLNERCQLLCGECTPEPTAEPVQEPVLVLAARQVTRFLLDSVGHLPHPTHPKQPPRARGIRYSGQPH